MRLVLEITSGPNQGKKIEAKVGETVSVGRTSKATVALGDDFMSGAHFAVECDAKGCRVRDLNSRNGTKLNGELIIEAALKDGDQVHAGHTDFIVRLEADAKRVTTSEQRSSQRPAAVETRSSRRQKPTQVEPRVTSQSPPVIESKPPSPIKTEPRPLVQTESASAIESGPRAVMTEAPASPERAVIPPHLLASYRAATPEGRLVKILSDQPGTLMALIDAVRDLKVLDLLRTTAEEYQSLYRSEQNANVAPYLVRLPPHSELLKQMTQRGWGLEWGVYITCPLSLAELRDYFRKALMVTMPDGTELFSRFYDPRFFRAFLETCTAAEAEKFFGPVTSYFMEDERPEILLQFTRSRRGAEKKGHLLSDLS